MVKIYLTRTEPTIIKHHGNMASVDRTLPGTIFAAAQPQLEESYLRSVCLMFSFIPSLFLPFLLRLSFFLFVHSFIDRSLSFSMLRHFSFVRHHIWTKSGSHGSTSSTRRCCNDKSFLLFVFATPSIAFFQHGATNSSEETERATHG